ncbi:hypothetical protein [Marinobacter nauticus]|uniref:Uncharacterized protein n=1 Tax=Marinobacter nauticus TaxID=2743 RepID=A0A833JU12_MARNT|nr:hypothetical protein [Marinobacter nauticus]KAE8546115.1 hypothetical protein F6453_1361 [Marinobacter nauticus]
MRVTITLDRYDGSQSKQKEVNLEEVQMSDLIMLLTEADTAGVTITKVKDIRKMVERMEEPADEPK